MDLTPFDRKAESPPMACPETRKRLRALRVDCLILTGGEPLIHQRSQGLRSLLGELTQEIHVETNGTIKPDRWMADRVAHWSVSPKLANSGDNVKLRVKIKALEAFAESSKPVAWKFVVVDPGDLIEVQTFCGALGIPPARVWIMPEGRNGSDIIERARTLEPHVLRRGYNLSLRQQVLLHGDTKGT